MTRNCAACGEPLPLDWPGYRRYCTGCYFALRDEQQATPAPISTARAAEVLGLDADMLRVLLAVAHPDRHGNSAAATRATQWLLQLRSELGGDS